MPSISHARSERGRSKSPALPLFLLATCLCPSSASGQEIEQTAARQLAIRVGTVHPVSGPAIDHGIILVTGKLITLIGRQGEVDIPDGARIVDLPGSHAYPGLVDAMSGAYLEARERNNRAVDGGTRIVDGLDPYDRLSRGLIKAGVTTAYVSNHSEGTWRGLGTILRPGPDGFLTMVDKETAGLEVRMTSGKSPQHALTRKTQLAAICKSFEALEAYQKTFTKHAKASKEYAEKFAAYLKYHQNKKEKEKEKEKDGEDQPEDEAATEQLRDRRGRGRRGRGRRGQQDGEKPVSAEPKAEAPAENQPADPEAEVSDKAEDKDKDKDKKPPERPKYPKVPSKDPAKEALLEALNGALPLRAEAHRQDEIRAFLSLVREYEIQYPVLEFATAAGSMADELAQAGVPVLLADIDAKTAKLYGAKQRANLAAQLAAAGVPIAITSGGSIRRGQHLPTMAALACGNGLSEADALRTITLSPAEILGIADQVGSLEVGKIADIVISSGPLLRSDSRILRVFSAGDLHYEAK